MVVLAFFCSMDRSAVFTYVENRFRVALYLSVLDAGGDFADGVIAYEGNWLGGETFVSFDKKAVALLKAQGQQARFLS